ncbi:MAG: adenosylmethionine--8-amino-7-oxononanoate transaminase [bacterium]
MKLKKLKDLDRKYIWHPFTQMQDWIKEEPLIIEEGKGAWVKDIDGKWYIDGVSSLWTNVHGHRKQEIDRAIKKQIDKISHSTLLGLSNVPATLLAEKLIKLAPKGLTRVFYSDSGSEGVEIALKMAFQYWQQIKNPNFKLQNPKQIQNPNFKKKTKFLTLVNAYHGDTIGAVSVGGIDLFHKIYKPLLFKSIKAPTPYCYRCPFKYEMRDERCGMRCLKEVEKLMKKHHKEIAAMIVEPLVQAAAGILVYPKGYLKGIRKLCTKYDILMIVDEVAVGFGRTGKMFACEHEGVSPDLMIVAKGLTGGYLPVAATLATEKVFRAFLGRHEDMKTFYHGHTYTGNPLGCAAAIASIDLFKKERTLQALQPKIKLLENRLKEFRKLAYVGDVRQCGFLACIELVRDKKTKQDHPAAEKIGVRVIMEARKLGLIIRPLSNVIVIMPPLCISKVDLSRMLDIIYYSIKKVTEGKVSE